MARHRRPHSSLPRAIRSAAAATLLSMLAVGTASMAFAPSADAAPATAPSATCPGAHDPVTGSQTIPAGKPPKLRHDKIITSEDIAGSVNVLANDGSSDGDLTLIAVTRPDHGTVQWQASGDVTYRPDDGYVGFDQFDYTAGDEAGRTSTNGTVGVRVCNVGPTAEAVSLVGVFNHDVGFNPLDHATAPAGDHLSLWSFTQPKHGQTAVVGDQLVYRPNTGFFGTDNFTYTVTDGQGICSTAPVTIRIPVETKVSPIPPIERSPTPTLPATGPSDVGWLALGGLLLVAAGGAVLFSSTRLGRRSVAVAGVADDPALVTDVRRNGPTSGRRRPAVSALMRWLVDLVDGPTRAPPYRSAGPPTPRRQSPLCFGYL
jgi:LPXTG-motif cell wall-anchored protein